MEYGYVSVRKIEKLCKTDIRFMWLLQNNNSPSHMTMNNFINETLLGNMALKVNKEFYIIYQSIYPMD